MHFKRFYILFVIVVLTTFDALAAQIPGSADAGRVDKDHKTVIMEEGPKEESPQIVMPEAEIPKGADKVKIKLDDIKLEGVTAFSKAEIKDLYKQYLGKEVTIDTIWKIADLITQHYQKAGYFLSRAYVPKQEIDRVVTIKIGEGYVGEVELNDPLADNYIIRDLIGKLKAQKPAGSEAVEELLLRLNDLPGVTFRSVMNPLPGSDGAVKLVLVKEDKKGGGAISFDNFNSRYLGPYEGVASYETSIIPLQQTSVSFLGGVPLDKLKYFSGSHNIPLSSELSMQIYGGYTEANPGFTLSPREIESTAKNLGISLKDQFIRQRQENLSGTITFDGKNNYSDVLGQPLNRDRVRAIRVNASYDRNDPYNGYDFINLTLSHGVELLDASSKGQPFLSRAGAGPDFTKLEYSFNRFQGIGESFTAVTALTGQLASSVLYSSEQFGYGGQAFGRAYDPSEFVGDKGIAGSLELRYSGLPPLENISFAPYSFYDVGKVWGGGSTSMSGSSAGGGIRMEHSSGISGNFLIAEPLTRRISDPSSGNGKSARILFQISYKF